MKYYFLSNSTDEKEIGKSYPQCKGIPSRLGLNKNWFNQEDSMSKLKNSEFPTYNPDLRFELKKNAILTDLISTSNISAKGLLLSEKAKNIFTTCNLAPYRVYPASVIQGSINHQYFWLHLVKENLEGIDFLNSKFHITNLAFMKIENLNILSNEDYIIEKNKLKMKHIRAEKISLTKNYSDNLFDLIFFPLIHSNIFISQNLANKIKKNNLTGFNIENQNILI